MRTSAHEQNADTHQPRLGGWCEVFTCCDLCGSTMLAHLQVDLSQILAPDHGRRLRSFPITMKAKGAKHFLKAERDTEAWEAQCPFVCTHKRLRFVWVHKTAGLCSNTKMQMSKALSEALHIQDSVKKAAGSCHRGWIEGG